MMGKITISLLFCISLFASTKAGTPGYKYINAVEKYANDVFEYGKDTYGNKHTPLLADGINVKTKEPVKWHKDGETWILSSLASQQNLFRTLVGLTNLTGKPKYRQAAENAIKYSFENLRGPNGLLYWGGHIAYDLQGDKIEMEFCLHELKSHYPYYELMWDVDPKATKELIEAFWADHVLNWSNLDMNRHGYYKKKPDKIWENNYEEGEVFFWGEGLTFINAGSDLFYAGAILSKLSGEKDPLIWAKRLAYRYVETRDPNIGISGYQYSQDHESWCLWDGRKPLITGDRAQYQFGEFFKGKKVYESTLFFPGYSSTPCVDTRIVQMYLGEILEKDGREFTNWAIEELIAWGKHAYRKEDNSFVPMLTDGSSLEGFVIQKEGYFGPKGRVLYACKARPIDFWTYCLGYRISENKFILEIAKNMGKGLGFGDIGIVKVGSEELNLKTKSSDPYAILGFLELYKKTCNKSYLEMARRIGDNIIKDRVVDGVFVESKKHIYTRFSRDEPLVLLQLAAVIEGRQDLVPIFYPSSHYFDCAYEGIGRTTDEKIIYSQKVK